MSVPKGELPADETKRFVRISSPSYARSNIQIQHVAYLATAHHGIVEATVWELSIVELTL
jgi:hypothetical protein